LVEEREGKTTVKPRRILETNVKTNLKETRQQIVDWIYMVSVGTTGGLL
jgi:hypothetical protein